MRSESSRARSRRPATTTLRDCSCVSVCDRAGRREARRARHDRGAVRRALQRARPALGDPAAVPVAERPRDDLDRDRRARRRGADAIRPRGVRVGLRDLLRPAGRASDHDAAVARGQVPRVGSRRRRVSVHHDRRTASRCCRSPRSGSSTGCSDKRISTGMPRLDAMLGGKGFYRGSSVLVSGSPGAGKTAWRRSSSTQHAGAGSERCTLPTRSRLRRSCATCARSASNWPMDRRRIAVVTGRASDRSASRPTWRGCTRSSEQVSEGGRRRPDQRVPRARG